MGISEGWRKVRNYDMEEEGKAFEEDSKGEQERLGREGGKEFKIIREGWKELRT